MNLTALPIGLVAGMAAALLFAGLVTQSPGAVVLALAAPVPILIASLGWGSRAGFIAAGAAAVAIAAFMGSILSGATMLLGSALPAAVIGHMAGLARPVGHGDGLDWYPLSRLLFAIAAISAVTCVVLGLLLGYDASGLEAAVTSALLSQPDSPVTDPEQVQTFVRFVIAAIPFVQPTLTVLTLIASLYVSAAITRLSGRLPGPRTTSRHPPLCRRARCRCLRSGLPHPSCLAWRACSAQWWPAPSAPPSRWWALPRCTGARASVPRAV